LVALGELVSANRIDILRVGYESHEIRAIRRTLFSVELKAVANFLRAALIAVKRKRAKVLPPIVLIVRLPIWFTKARRGLSEIYP
jgi:hypothetical protein